jgi:hypothetical protein
MKLKRSHSDATLMQNGTWAYHASACIDDIEEDFFDDIVYDVIDPEKYISAPLASGLGSTFQLFVGELKKNFAVGTFRVDGVKTRTDDNGLKHHNLQWSQIGDWAFVDLERTKKKAA